MYVSPPRVTASHVYPSGQASTAQSNAQKLSPAKVTHKSPVALQCPSTAHVPHNLGAVLCTHTRTPDAFFKSLSLKESTAYAPRLYYFLAMALYQTSDFEGARRFFARIQPGLMPK